MLIIEDDLFISEMYANKFTEAGFEVDSAKDGREALAKLEETEFDMILLDRILPDMDGLEILKKIKTNSKLKDKTKVFILTNVGEKKDAEEALNLGAELYFLKANFTPTEIVEKIKEILEKTSEILEKPEFKF